MSKRLFLILGDSLYPAHENLLDEDLIFMAEDYGLCTHYRYHKHKIVLFLAAMRNHADELIAKGKNIVYRKLQKRGEQPSYEDKLTGVLDKQPSIQELVTYEIEDHFFKERIQQLAKDRQLKLNILKSPGFINTQKSFEAYISAQKKPFMQTFYQQQRKALNVLIDEEGKPEYGKWSFDAENRKKLPKGLALPDVPEFDSNTNVEAVKNLVNELFENHPGSVDNFSWATTRKEALACLDDFLEKKFNDFGPYEDAIHSKETFIFHSTLSPYLNLGLITPDEVIDKALAHAEKNDIHYPSLEGFVRQIIGWREFLRGIYHHYDDKLNINFFGHHRKLKSCWYDGTTGIPPLDDAIKKAVKYGYTHHIERLMVIGNIMLMCEIDPDEVYKWFMEMYVDSADWVMAPNVYGMSQFADGGIFATKPYISGGNYILKMSNYKKGEWSEIMNGLYWRFIESKKSFFQKNQRMGMMVSTLEKMNEEKKSTLFQKAEQFINNVTHE
ncbi:MAG TPA: cryptochrome/photolyase family protein [Cyclobacteriaceae bacterium]